MKRYFLYVFIFLLILLVAVFFLMFHPVNNSPSNSLVVIGNVVDVYEGGVKDACLSLEFDSCCYYMNRGLEKGLNIENLRSILLNKEVKIHYADYWSLFNVAARSRHINQLEYSDSIIFTEW